MRDQSRAVDRTEEDQDQQNRRKQQLGVDVAEDVLASRLKPRLPVTYTFMSPVFESVMSRTALPSSPSLSKLVGSGQHHHRHAAVLRDERARGSCPPDWKGTAGGGHEVDLVGTGQPGSRGHRPRSWPCLRESAHRRACRPQVPGQSGPAGSCAPVRGQPSWTRRLTAGTTPWNQSSCPRASREASPRTRRRSQ